MTWINVDSKEVVQGLSKAKKVCVRYVLLSRDGDGGPSLDDLVELSEAGPAGVLGASAAQRYALVAYSTDPPTVLLSDKTEDQVIAVYVWKGEGGVITTGADPRLLQVADLLDAEFRGEQPPAFEDPPMYHCPDCGHVHNGASGHATAMADVQMSSDTRAAMESLDLTRWFELLAQHTKPPQLRMVEQLLDLGCTPGPLSAFRRPGGPAVEEFIVILLGPNDEMFTVFPDGRMEAEF